jgi:sec-independent protein translocase protein TatA
MFGLGPTELILILAVVLIIFGAGKLPQVFGALGKGVKEFRNASEGTAASETAGQEPLTVPPTTPATAIATASSTNSTGGRTSA